MSFHQNWAKLKIMFSAVIIICFLSLVLPIAIASVIAIKAMDVERMPYIRMLLIGLSCAYLSAENNQGNRRRHRRNNQDLPSWLPLLVNLAFDFLYTYIYLEGVAEKKYRISMIFAYIGGFLGWTQNEGSGFLGSFGGGLVAEFLMNLPQTVRFP